MSTIIGTGTGRAVIVGTPAYMSPEQACGETLDRRTDIWSFGCVLFEMLTGVSAFGGPTMSDIIGDVLRGEPAWNRLPAGTPSAIRLLLRRCLTRDRRRRQQSIADIRVELEQLLGDPAASQDSDAAVPRPRSSATAAWTVAALATVAAALFAAVPLVRTWGSAAPVKRETIFEIATPGAGPIAISRDGRAIAYLAPATAGAPPSLWVRRLDALEPRVLAGTENAGHFNWAPDGDSILFAAAAAGLEKAKLKRVDVSRGSIQTLADHGPYRGSAPAAIEAGLVLFLGSDRRLHAIAATGGEPSDVLPPDAARPEIAQQWPAFLPDGRHFLYLSSVQTGSAVKRAINVASLDSKAVTRLMDSESEARFAPPDTVFYVTAEKILMARPFNPQRLQWSGEARPIAEGVTPVPSSGMAPFDVSRDGTLIYRSGGTPPPVPLQWIDRSGNALSSVCGGAPAPKSGWRLAPDGKRAVIELARRDLSLCDLERGTLTPLTRDGLSNRAPVWSPDGARVVFAASKNRTDAGTSIYEIAATGAEPERVLMAAEAGVDLIPLDWARDGSRLVVSRQERATRSQTTPPTRDLWIVPMIGDRKPQPYLTTASDEMQASISPNGKWLAFASNESGSDYDVYVRPFPNPVGGAWRVSVEGGCCPRWKSDSSELFFLNADRRLVNVPISRASASFAPGAPRVLAATAPLVVSVGVLGEGMPYDVSLDGQRFLIHPIPPSENGPTTITVVLNWTARRR
jgi:Tol biopolymer transport system component